MKCYICEPEFHLKANCPKKTTNDGQSMGNGKVGSIGDGKPSFVAWRYIHLDDPDSEITVNDTKYYFCKHCTCKFTGKQGFYNRTHTTSNNKFPRRKSDDASTTPIEASTVTGVSSISSLRSGSAILACTLGVFSPTPSNVKPKASPIPEDATNSDSNGLDFV